MIGKLYQKFDSGMMKLADKAVHAYNWTTGGTKAELANNLNSLAIVPEALGLLANPLGFKGAILAVPAYFYATHLAHKINSATEKREVQALKSGAKDMLAENVKLIHRKVYCTTFPGFALNEGAAGIINSDVGFGLLGVGMGTRTLAEYVMQVDYLPPRKSCVERGLDKIVELGKSLRLKPCPVGVNCSRFLDANYLSYLEARR